MFRQSSSSVGCVFSSPVWGWQGVWDHHPQLPSQTASVSDLISVITNRQRPSSGFRSSGHLGLRVSGWGGLLQPLLGVHPVWYMLSAQRGSVRTERKSICQLFWSLPHLESVTRSWPGVQLTKRPSLDNPFSREKLRIGWTRRSEQMPPPSPFSFALKWGGLWEWAPWLLCRS